MCQIYSKLVIKTPERHLILLLLTLNIFCTLFYCSYCWIRTNKCYWALITTHFFYKQHFINSVSVLLNFFINWASNIAWVLLNIYMTIIIQRHFIFSVFVFMCRPRSIYVYLYILFFIFSLIFIAMNHMMSLKHSHLFFVHFKKYLLLFLDHNMDEKNK